MSKQLKTLTPAIGRKGSQELVNRIESSLRGLEYIETLPDGTFKALNRGCDNYGFTHIDGIRHERSVCTANILSSLYRAFVHSFENMTRGRTNMVQLNGII